MSADIALIYGSSTCYTEIIAERIQKLLGENRIDLINIAHDSVFKAYSYEFLIFGIPTWDYGELQEDWDNVWDELADLDLKGKTAAIYGLGDQLGYGEWFQDAMGYLHSQLLACGATLVGLWPNEGYSFTASKALNSDQSFFYGLALDEENQADLTDSRLQTWLASLPLPDIQVITQRSD